MPGDDPARAVAEAVLLAADRHLARIPGRYRGASRSGLKTEQRPGLIDEWLSTPDATTLMLAGDHGVGKTWMAAAVANAVAVASLRTSTRGIPVGWWSVAGLLDDLRPSAPRAEVTWELAKNVPFLVLDDLAYTRPTEWAVERMWMLADHRVNTGLRQVITTNAKWPVLESTWGPGTMDRLRDGALDIIVTGPSRRTPLRGVPA